MSIKYEVGDIVNCEVLGVSDHEVSVDLNAGKIGIIAFEDLSEEEGYDPHKHLRNGRHLTAQITSLDDGRGNIRLSVNAARHTDAWDQLKDAHSANETLTVHVREQVKGGVVAYLKGLRAFIPASQLAASYVDNLADFVGRDLEVKIDSIEPAKRRLVLSARAVEQEKKRLEQQAKLDALEVGSIVEGTVARLKDFGAFVNIADGLDGLVHISQISLKRVEKVEDALRVGQKVRVKITGMKDGKVSLSMKAVELLERPSKEAAARKAQDEQVARYADRESTGTSLADLLGGIKLD